VPGTLLTDPARVLGFVDLINGTGDGVPVNLKKRVKAATIRENHNLIFRD
jgi:hypothetical protein